MNDPTSRQPSLLDTLWAQVKLNWQHLRDERIRFKARHDIPTLRAQIDSILESMPKGKRAFIFAPGLSWDRQLFQRPQQLAIALAGLGETVFYIEPFVDSGDLRIEEVRPNLIWVQAPPAVLNHASNPLLYLLPWCYSPERYLQPVELIYDIVDDFAAFAVDPRLLRYQHARRMKKARLVLATAQRLVDIYRLERPDLVYLPNAVDAGHFSQQGLPTPEDLKPYKETRRVLVGYFGALAEWFDDELIRQVALLRRDVEFILIGPAHGKHLFESGLLQAPNVHWLGEKPYHDLPAYLNSFAVTMIPFKLNAITHATSPLKLFEYMAGGKPVIITAMDESMRVPHVLTAGNALEFSRQIDRALVLSDDEQFRIALHNTARQNTWEARARKILASLEMV